MTPRRFPFQDLFLAIVYGIVAFGTSPADAQTPLPRPAVAITKMPSLWYNVWPADFNRDGRTDLVAGGGMFGILGPMVVRLGNGNGTFGPAREITSGHARPLGVGDLNGDRRTDVVALMFSAGSFSLTVLPGNGDGTFGSPRPVGAAFEGPAVVADLDNDGNRDIVLGDRLYSGNGDFTFDSPLTLPTFGSGVIAADLNGDSRLDLAVATGETRLEILRNNGGLLFTLTTIPMDELVLDITAWDMDGDGDRDLVASGGLFESFEHNTYSDGKVWVFENDGSGTFAPPAAFDTLPGPINVVAGDFNRDGRPDVATANLSSVFNPRCDANRLGDSLTILPGNGDGSLGAAANFALANRSSQNDQIFRGVVHSLNTADLNGDRQTDLIVSPGAIVLNVPASPNRPPVANAGPDGFATDHFFVFLDGDASDPDHDWLSYRWTDATGRTLADVPDACLIEPEYVGEQTFTLTADDGRGGVASDTVVLEFPDPSSPLPIGWRTADIGNVGATGSASGDNDEGFTVVGSGADIWGSADEFRFAYQRVSGDFFMLALVDEVENVHRWTKAGIMVRESLEPGSRHASLFATPTTEKGVAFQRRTTANGVSTSTAGPSIAPRVWLYLYRVGNLVSAYVIPYGTTNRILVGRESFAALPETLYVGLAVTSHSDGRLATAKFSTAGWGPIQQEWTSEDIGAVALPGRTLFDGFSIESEGSGTDIWGTADAFRFTSVPWTAPSLSLEADVRSIENTHAWAKAGVMIRDGNAPNAKHVMVIVSPGNGIAMQYRAETGGITAQVASRPGAASTLVRLDREGDTFIGYVVENNGWVELGRVTVSMPTDTRVGFAVTSHNNGRLATAEFSNVVLQQP